MIEKDTICELKEWFAEYVKEFYKNEPDFDRNILLKQEHTLRVCQEISDLGKSLELEPSLLALAEVAALFHDIGRFEQFSRYKTFADKNSENHAALGVKILLETQVLQNLHPEDREIILKAVSFHNRAEIPPEANGNCLLIAKMLRDADKLDIWNVVTDYYKQKQAGLLINSSLELDLPDNNEISDSVFNSVLSGKIIKSSEICTLNDFKLLQMGWVFDLNFPHSLRQVKQRNYLQAIRDAISNREKAIQAFHAIGSHLP